MKIDDYALKHIERQTNVQVSVGIDKDLNVCMVIDNGARVWQIPFDPAAAIQLGGHLVTAASSLARMKTTPS